MNDRVGEQLWSEWDGELYESSSEEPIVYYTYDHIDVDTEIVKRALASAIQRDGVADSLGDAFKMIENAMISHGYAGYLLDSLSPVVCDVDGETFYGDIAETYREVTFVEIQLGVSYLH